MKAKIVGVGGTFASGKSTFCAYLKGSGVRVFKADSVARAILRKPQVSRAILEILGQDCRAKSGLLNRRVAAEVMFNNPRKRRLVERIIHPSVKRQCLRWIKEYARLSKLLILDVPLLFEAGYDKLCDYSVAVVSPRRLIYKRAKKKRFSHNLTDAVLSSQWSVARKSSRAHAIVRNDKSLGHLREMAKDLKQKLIKSIKQGDK